MGIPVTSTSSEFVTLAKSILDSINDFQSVEEKYFATKRFFKNIANNLIHFKAERFNVFGRTICNKLREFLNNGNEYEVKIANDYGWIVEELEINI